MGCTMRRHQIPHTNPYRTSDYVLAGYIALDEISGASYCYSVPQEDVSTEVTNPLHKHIAFYMERGLTRKTVPYVVLALNNLSQVPRCGLYPADI